MELLIYLLFVLQKLSIFCFIGILLSSIGFFVLYGLYNFSSYTRNGYDRNKEDETKMIYDKKLMKICAIVFCICTFICVLSPSLKEAAVIYTVPKIVNNETVSQECQELYDLGKEYLKNAVENQKD